jgi:serine/threonine protein phosphatase PrpC
LTAATPVAVALAPDPIWRTDSGPPPACGDCGATGFTAGGHCAACGARRPAAPPHSELDLGGVAAVTDLGRRHHRNEDAVGIGAHPGLAVGVVCDGVSSSTRPDAASHAAVDAATATLVAGVLGNEAPGAVITKAAAAAQAAAALVAGARPSENPPACTFVSAIVTADDVTVGWVGDSRAYWLPDDDRAGAICLTIDDSLAGRLAAVGSPVPATGPARALTRWLGADAADTTPHVRSFRPVGRGRVVVCSDGLFSYAGSGPELAAAAIDGPPLATAQQFVRFALAAGGHDNISAVVLAFPPAAEPAALAIQGAQQ